MIADPFDSASDAKRGDVHIRDRSWGAPPKRLQEVASKPKQKKVDLNPLQRRWFEREGFTYARVEKTNTFGAVTVDLWGFADYLACRPGEIVLVQVTTMDHAANREKKARKAPELEAWLRSGGRFQVHAWKQPGGAGSKWVNVVREVTL